MAAKTPKKTPTSKGAVSSVSEKGRVKEIPAIPDIKVEYNGKKYAPLVHALHTGGKDYTAGEFMKDETVLKFLVEESFNRHGVSCFIKEVF